MGCTIPPVEIAGSFGKKTFKLLKLLPGRKFPLPMKRKWLPEMKYQLVRN
jgi:hypothetical protein